MNDFSLNVKWPPATSKKAIDLDPTFGSLAVDIGGRNVTSFTSEDEEASDRIELPLAYIAEWIAENWWAILWEPRKSDDAKEDDEDFQLRHSLLAAQHGFYLPHISFVSNGPYISVAAQPRDIPFSDARFVTRSNVLADRAEVEEQFRKFVQETYERAGRGQRYSYFKECWEAVISTDEDAVDYCRMVGALGLSPYADLGEIDEVLDRVTNRLGTALALELCLVAKPSEILKSERAAMVAVAVANKSAPINMETLNNIPVPKDGRQSVAWLRGTKAARLVREAFGISDLDREGATKLFDRVRIDPKQRASIGASDFQAEGAAIVGAALREEAEARISFIQRHEPQRRFAAARGIFSAWASDAKQGHLLTQAVTRYQQASRAFAAEITAPLAFIRKAAPKRQLSYDDIDRLAEELIAGTDVVFNQAVNNGLQVVR